MNTAIEISNLSFRYNHQIVLDNINLKIQEKEFFVFIGPNGGGKTTLLKAILGLIKPEKGKIEIFGKSKIDFRLLGYVPQFSKSDREFPINVWDTVLLGRIGQKKLFQSFNAFDKTKTEEALKRVEMLDFSNVQIGELSEGQRQRVFIARALVSDPKILVLDEPTASIDKHISTNIYDLLNELKAEMTVIMVTHDIGAISGYVTKLACLNKRLYFHNSKQLQNKDFEEAYGCPFELITHGVPHRVYPDHLKGE